MVIFYTDLGWKQREVWPDIDKVQRHGVWRRSVTMLSATGSLEEASEQGSYRAPKQLVLSQDLIYENMCVVKVDGHMALPPSLQLLIKNT